MVDNENNSAWIEYQKRLAQVTPDDEALKENRMHYFHDRFPYLLDAAERRDGSSMHQFALKAGVRVLDKIHGRFEDGEPDEINRRFVCSPGTDITYYLIKHCIENYGSNPQKIASIQISKFLVSAFTEEGNDYKSILMDPYSQDIIWIHGVPLSRTSVESLSPTIVDFCLSMVHNSIKLNSPNTIYIIESAGDMFGGMVGRHLNTKGLFLPGYDRLKDSKNEEK